MVTFGELANTFGVNISSGLRKPRVRNPGLQFANAFGVNTSAKDGTIIDRYLRLVRVYS